MAGNGINNIGSSSVFLSQTSLNRGETNPFVNKNYVTQIISPKEPQQKTPKLNNLLEKLENNFNKFILSQRFYAYANEHEIKNMIETNPKINNILKANGIETKINLTNLQKIYNSHLIKTVEISKKIGEVMELNKEEIKTLEKGALFHDFGKVLIPSELLDKPGQLTLDERKIVSLHAGLGYELLKTTGMEQEVVEIVKNHHRYKSNLDNSHSSKLSQIVTVADIYSALTEERSYKKAMSNEHALKVLDKLASEGKVDIEIVNALKKGLVSQKIAA